MDSVLRAAVTYLFVWLIFRIAGKRSLAQITTFDAVLLLIISETTQGALLDDDQSLTNTMLLILTILGLDVFFSNVKQCFPKVEKVLDGAPLIVLDHRGLRKEAMRKERVSEGDIRNAARQLQGLASIDQIEYAVLEQTGVITIMPQTP